MDDNDEGLHPRDEDQRSYVLITGANSGLGFGICCRLIDEFITTRPSYQSLTLIFTTRDAKKGNDTVQRLRKHINRLSRSLDALLATRITLQPENLDLMSLVSVHKLAAKLSDNTPHLDTIILNAGMGGTTGIAWGAATWSLMTDFLNALTYPTYKLSSIGSTAARQISVRDSGDGKQDGQSDEPPLGQVFTSNVFGHYILSHALLPLLSGAPDNGRIIFISSLEAYAHVFDLNDIQCLNSDKAYESSKRVTDLLVLTSTLPSTSPITKRFFAPPTSSTPPKGIQLNDNAPSSSSATSSTSQLINLTDNEHPKSAQASQPSFYLAQPGICATSFVPLPLFLYYCTVLCFYIARLLGSPWHTVSAYNGAVAPVWLALTPQDELEDLEVEAGKGKWGSASDWRGRLRVMRTGVAGWGLGGRVGLEKDVRRGKGEGGGVELTREGREAFEEMGRECWKAVEGLRVEWEERLRGDGE